MELLKRARDSAPWVYTKSGLMVGLEKPGRNPAVMQDLRVVDCGHLGNTSSPVKKHLQVDTFVPPEHCCLEAVWRVLRFPPGCVLTSNPQLLSCRAGEELIQTYPRSRF